MSKIAIVGFGFVGSAVFETLKSFHECVIIDPKHSSIKLEEVSDSVDGLILSLPTPESEDGSCDISIINNVLSSCPRFKPILIKSTIALEKWKHIASYFSNLSITYSPEFLTAANAVEDFKNQSSIYLAGKDCEFWLKIFRKAMPETTVYFEDKIDTLILAKYFRNSFLALKVAYANQMYEACQKLNIDYDSLKFYFGEDPRIGSSHTQVPGPDNLFGFGGACFPKDTSALLATAKHYNIDLSILESAVKYNKQIRE